LVDYAKYPIFVPLYLQNVLCFIFQKEHLGKVLTVFNTKESGWWLDLIPSPLTPFHWIIKNLLGLPIHNVVKYIGSIQSNHYLLGLAPLVVLGVTNVLLKSYKFIYVKNYLQSSQNN
jgi:hypothetical protein